MKRSFTHNTWWATPLVGLCGAVLASHAGWPLPWITGALLAVILTRCLGWRIEEVPHGRTSGQLIIAISIGLHLTSPVVAEIARHFLLIACVSFLMLALALLGIAVMQRQYRDLPTVFFAFMPANFSEMIQLGLRYQANTTRIAAAHSMRMVLIVLCVPALLFFSSDMQAPAIATAPASDWPVIALLQAGGVLAALAWKRCRLPNPWMFGPMLLAGLSTLAFDLALAMPSELSHYGQLMIGCSLGSFIDRDFFRDAPGFLLRVTLFILAMILCTFALAWALALFSDLPVRTLALGMMPGSSTEMYLTAEALQLAVGVVTAMQITRLVVVMLLAEPIYRYWLARELARRAQEPGSSA